jgi:hypothetical protein
MRTNLVVVFALLLIAIWVIATVTRFVVGALLNVLLVVGIVLLIGWAIGRLRA